MARIGCDRVSLCLCHRRLSVEIIELGISVKHVKSHDSMKEPKKYRYRSCPCCCKMHGNSDSKQALPVSGLRNQRFVCRVRLSPPLAYVCQPATAAVLSSLGFSLI